MLTLDELFEQRSALAAQSLVLFHQESDGPLEAIEVVTVSRLSPTAFATIGMPFRMLLYTFLCQR